MLPFMGVRVTGDDFYGCEGEKCCLLWVRVTGAFMGVRLKSVAFYGCEGDRWCL